MSQIMTLSFIRPRGCKRATREVRYWPLADLGQVKRAGEL